MLGFGYYNFLFLIDSKKELTATRLFRAIIKVYELQSLISNSHKIFL